MILGFFGILFCVSLGKGYLHIRARETQLHREWMIRAFALGLAIATTRLIEILALIVLIMLSDAGPNEQQFAPLVLISFTLAFSLHAILAEVWIRVSRRKRGVAAGAAQGRAQRHTEVVG